MGLFDKDFQEFIENLNKHNVDYILIGGHAVTLHGRNRTTGDLDIFIDSSEENANKLIKAIEDFGFDFTPLKEYLKIEKKSFGQFMHSRNISLPTASGPIEILGRISGIKSYYEANLSKKEVEYDGLKFNLISKDDLIKNKLASGRKKDIEDAKLLSQNSLEKKNNPKFKK